MIRRSLLTFLMIVMAVGLQSNEIGVTTLRNNAMKGLNVESGYEQEMAAWAYYCINGADGIAKDYYEAVKILKMLVERDENRVKADKFHYVVEGYNMLGDCYKNGWGINENIFKAKEYWQQAVNYNHADARVKLYNIQQEIYINGVNKNSNKIKNDIELVTVNGVSFKMIKVDGGTFRMGSNDSEAEDDESPVHNVTLSDYYIGETEVTQELWEAVMGNNPSYFKGSKNPVEKVSWDDCQEFIRKLNQLTGKNFRLPTEAEWEYAARGGNKSRGYKYSGSNNISDVAWYSDNSSWATHPVCIKSPNELGLYDMSGNVWEWCSDWYGENYYSSSPQTNPIGPNSGSSRVFRGGDWILDAQFCRVAIRGGNTPGLRFDGLGLRLVCASL